jgi:hypothetical protein
MNEPPEHPEAESIATNYNAPPQAKSELFLADMPPQIGRLRLEKVLGEGGFGRIYKAYDTELQRWVDCHLTLERCNRRAGLGLRRSGLLNVSWAPEPTAAPGRGRLSDFSAYNVHLVAPEDGRHRSTRGRSGEKPGYRLDLAGFHWEDAP